MKIPEKSPLVLGLALAALAVLAAGAAPRRGAAPAARTAPLLGAVQNSAFGYKQDVLVGPSDSQRQVVSWGGNVTIEGRVQKDVLGIGSTVTISGEVGGAVIGLGARVILKPTAVIKGDLVIFGGTLTKEPGCQVDGDTVYFKSEQITSRLFQDGFRGFLGFGLLPFILIIKLLSAFVWALLAFLVASLFPKNVTAAAAEARRSFGAVFGVGLLALIAFVILVAFSALLSIILIGIPILLALTLAGMVVKVFGRVVLFYLVGESIARAFRKPTVTVIGGSLLGLVAVSLVSFVPLFGGLVTFVLSILGWGVALRTKFGTTENWFARAPKV
jgi:hypothetical protein